MRPYFLLIIFSLCTGIASNAQVLVKHEPRHKNVFENEIIRVLDVWIQPGDTTLFHIHETPSIFVTFTNTLIGTQLWNEPAIESKSNRGGTSYNSFYPKPRIHRVWNADTTNFHVMDIEILATTKDTTSYAIQNPNFQLSADEEKARIYSLKISSKKRMEMETAGNPILIVVIKGKLAITDFVGESVKLIPGSFHWVEKYTKVKVENIQEKQMEGYVFEIKL